MSRDSKYNTLTGKATFRKGVRYGEVPQSSEFRNGSINSAKQNLADTKGTSAAAKSLRSRYSASR